MDFLFKIAILCLYCLHSSVCELRTYRAANVNAARDVIFELYPALIYDASQMNADILVLPSPEASRCESIQHACGLDKYDEIVKSISDASKRGKLYVVAHLMEKVRCEGRQEVIRSNLVFDREGTVVAVKPLQGLPNCNITSTNPATFTTDFGVTFGLLMEEDLILKNLKEIQGIKNIVLSGKSTAKLPFLSASQFSASWSYVTNANLVSSEGIFSGRAGLKTGGGNIIVVELDKNGGDAHQAEVNFNGPSKLTDFPTEDLSQYTVRPLNVEASARGYRETVCHDKFCCHFHLKTSFIGEPMDVSYGLAAYSGVRHIDQRRSVGVQSCALLACAGLYKRSCFVNSVTSTSIIFVEIAVSANFTPNSAQFPVVHTTTSPFIESNRFQLSQHPSESQISVVAKLYNTTDVLSFGVLSRDYTKDYESVHFDVNKTDGLSVDYIVMENFEEFFDYLWIRLRVVIFVVSIYILEMM